MALDSYFIGLVFLEIRDKIIGLELDFILDFFVVIMFLLKLNLVLML